MSARVLVVDDEPDIREVLQQALIGAGFEVEVAGSGIEAVSRARQVRPDLILLDLMLPDVDGYTVVELLRRHADTAAVPVVMLSAAFGAAGAHPAPGPAGVTRYCTKSIPLAELVLRIRETLGQTRPPRPADAANHDCSEPQAG